MKLYYFPGSCALATHIVLEWTGVPHETVRMSRQSIKGPDYLALNAAGTVPLLLDDDFSLTENAAILTYLAELHPQARLLGGGTLRGKAEVMRWLGLLNSDVHKAFRPIFAPGRFLQDPAAADALGSMARGHVLQYLERLESRLVGRDWLADDRSIADPYLFVILRWAKYLGLPDFDNLSRFFARMSSDVGVRTALDSQEGDHPLV